MSTTDGDSFDQLAGLLNAPVPGPRAEFVDDLRLRVHLGLDHDRRVQTPTRQETTMTTTSPTRQRASTVTTYLTVHDGASALAWYERAFGAEVRERIVHEGKIAHAELSIRGVRFFLSDEYPEMGVVAPTSLGGTPFAVHLEVDDVDADFESAVGEGATAVAPPEDQPHGARHGTLVDPFGHRWMLSTTLVELDRDAYSGRMAEAGMTVEFGTTAAVVASDGETSAAVNGRVWAAVNATDAIGMIRFMTDVLGFEEKLVVTTGDPAEVAHSQLRWAEGGILQVSSAGRSDNLHAALPTGVQSLYLISSTNADVAACYERCRAAEVEVTMAPTSTDYDPHGLVFTVRDHEGNLWSVGTYAGVE